MELDKSRAAGVLACATTDKTNVIIAGSFVAAAPLVGSWWLFIIGCVVYFLLVVWKCASPSYWRQALAIRAARLSPLPDPVRLSDPTLRATVGAIASARTELVRLLAHSPDGVRHNCRFLLASVAELEGRAARLVRRAEELSQYLRATRRETIHDELRRLDELARGAIDDEVRSRYLDARRAREEQLRAIEELHRAQELAVASLLRVVAIVEGLPPRIVRMRLLDAQVRDDVSTELDDEMERLTGEVSQSEQMLREIASDTPAMALLD